MQIVWKRKRLYNTPGNKEEGDKSGKTNKNVRDQNK